MNLIDALLASLLLLLGLFGWYLRQSRQLATRRQPDYDLAGRLLISLMLVALFDFLLLILYLLSRS
jgi:hypothetical protein